MLRRLDTGILGGTQPVMPVDTTPGTGIFGDVQSCKATSAGTQDVSALGESFDQTPLVVPVRGHLDSIKRLLRGAGPDNGHFSRADTAIRSKCRKLGGPLRSRVFGKRCSLILLSTAHSGLYLGRG